MRLDHSPFFRTTVGFDRLLDLLDQADGNAQGYPPYNIERSDENHYRVIVAVAGFAQQDLGVEVEGGVLTVTGKREAEAGAKPSFLHQGIAGRAFQRQFQLAEHVEVRGARLENGLLHIDLERIVPEEKKPRKIAIATSSAQDNGPRTIESARAA
jgi:molecular chaperone IbpA